MKAGDAVEKITAAIGIKPCRGCKRRKAILNGMTWKQFRTLNPLRRRNT